MSDPTIGGRGRRAPYFTKLTRVPEPIKPIVEALSQHYKELVMNYADPYNQELLDLAVSAIAPSAIATPVTCDQSQELERALQTLENLQASMEHLQHKLEQRDQVLNEALKMHSSHGIAIKRKIAKALKC